MNARSRTLHWRSLQRLHPQRRQHPGHAPGLHRLLARRVALLGAFRNALRDRGEPEETEGQYERPVRRKYQAEISGTPTILESVVSQR